MYVPMFRRYRPLKLPILVEKVLEEKVVPGPPICREDILQILDIHFQIALTSEHLVGLRSMSSDGSLRKEEEKEGDRIAVKPKSADNYTVNRKTHQFF